MNIPETFPEVGLAVNTVLSSEGEHIFAALLLHLLKLGLGFRVW